MVLLALGMVVLMGFAGLVTDVGAGQNEHRQDQTAADAAALDGAQHLAITIGAPNDAATSAMATARLNLQRTYSDSAWASIWSSCSDPDRDGTKYPDVSSVSPCISFGTGRTRIRVRLPDQVVQTTFARVLGITTLTTHAVAEAQLQPPTGGGVLPFGVVGFNADITNQVCATAAAGCGGSSGDTLRALDSPLVGNPQYGGTRSCRQPPATTDPDFGRRIEYNTAMGIDHLLVVRGGDPTRLDSCGVALPNTVWASSLQGSSRFTDFVNGLGAGLLTGPGSGANYPDRQPVRLKRIPNVPGWETRSVGGISVDNRPLWEFIPFTLASPAIPATCDRNQANPPWSKARMQQCLSDYVTGNYTAPMFTKRSPGTPPGTYDIQASPRFAFVPSFTSCCADGSIDAQGPIADFHMIFIQTLYLNASDTLLFEPGEGGTAMTLSKFDGLSALRMQDSMVPSSVLSSGPTGSLRGMSVQLIT